MPISTNTNVRPYFDDFDPNKNFYRVMYKPGFPIQARELTTTQSILQDQIEKLAGVFLKEGDTVVPGDFTVSIPASYVRLASLTQGATANSFVGFTLTGVTSGVKAYVNFATEKTEDDDPTLYVNYENDGSNSETATFLEGETLESNTPDAFTATVGINETSKPITTPPTGVGSIFTVNEGSYFVDGFIVRNDQQTIALDKYGVSPNFKVGFVVTEEFVDSVDDKSLLDNAQGSSNFAAPGADRLKISLTLVKRDPDAIDPNFITLTNLVQGNVVGNSTQTIKWDFIYDLLAKRTFDGSGDYIISEFPIQPLEYWDFLDTDNPSNVEVINLNPDGVFDPDENGFYPPVPGTGSTQPLTFSEANAKYAIRVSPGKAYIQGYEVGFTSPFFIYSDKPRVQGFVPNSSTQISNGYNIPISRLSGIPDLDNITGPGTKTEAFKDIVCYREFGDGFAGESLIDERLGRPINAGNRPVTTYHLILEKINTDSQRLPIDDTNIVNGLPTNIINPGDDGEFNVQRISPLVLNENTSEINSVVVVAPVGRTIKRGDTFENKKVLISRKITPTPTGIIRPKYLFNTDLVESGDFYGYNSVSRLGILGSEFFTEFYIIFDENDSGKDRNWLVGNIVIGEESNALGQVEEGSQGNRLILSSIVGSFKNGENVRQLFSGSDLTNILLEREGSNVRSQTLIEAKTDGDILLDVDFVNDNDDIVVKTGRIIRKGEVVGLEFDTKYERRYDPNNPDSIPRPTPGSSSVDTSEVRLFKTLTNNVELANFRINLPTLEDVRTQENYNEWIYRVLEEIDSTMLSNIDGGEATPAYDTSDPILVPVTRAQPTNGNYDLGSENYITVFALGARLVLFKEGSDGIDPGKGGFIYNKETNSLELTKFGRDFLYNFPYSNPQNTREIPRVNYTVITQNGISGYAVVVPAKITNTLTKTKSLFSELSDIPNFTSDVSFASSKDVNTLTLADGSLFSGTKGDNFIRCDDFLGDASDQLVGGDIVVITDDNELTQQFVVLFATQPFGYGPTRTPGYIYFTTTLSKKITGKRIERIRVKSFGKPSDNLIFQLPESVISSLESDPQNTGINYQVYKQFVTDELNAGEKEVRITTNKPNETFITDPFKFTVSIAKVTDRTEENISSFEGRLISLSMSNSIDILNQGTEVTLTFKSPLPVGSVLKIIAPIKVTNSQAKRKNLIRDYQQPFPFDPENPRDLELSPLSSQVVALEKADIFRLRSLMMTDGDGKQIDIKDNYIFDNGQRDGFYGLGQLLLKPGRPRPVGNVIATYDYFEHEGSGDFFSVDSYLHDRGVPYGLIPVYRPVSSEPEGNTDLSDVTIKLRDSIDFRPIVNTAPPTPSFLSINKEFEPVLNSNNFLDTRNGGDAFVPRVPIPNSQFECDIQFYLPKIDSLFLEKTGKMTLVEGIPSKNPVAPADLSTGIRLYDLFLPAYTFNIKDIRIEKFNYRKYTMKDISEIDSRLDKVEDLITLSILEISALNQSVRDAKTGLDRFKNGIIVDTFADHSKGNIGTKVYRNSIDFKESHLRPAHVWDQVALEETNQTDENREIFGFYVNNNGIVTSPFDNKVLISQPKATRSIKIQPYTNFAFEGKVKLTPSIDTYFDNRKIPDVVISDSKIWAAMVNIPADMVIMSLGTVWGSWENQGRVMVNKKLEFGRENQFRESRVNDLNESPFLYSNGLFSGESTLTIGSAALSLNEARGITKRQFSVNTGEPINTSNGERSVDTQILPTMRTIPVYINAERLKPNTRYFAFFDEVNVSKWVSVDNIEPEVNFPDGVARYSGVPNSNPKGFGTPLITDGEGNLQGVFLIPNGRPPVKGSIFNGSLNDVEYEVKGPTRSFKTGERYFRLTSSKNNSTDLSKIEGFAESVFVSGSVINDKSEYILATRSKDFTTQTRINEQQSNTDNELDSIDISDRPPFQKPSLRPRPRDPIAQTFNVDSNSPDGVFVSQLDVFFKKKDLIQGIEAYIVSTDGQTPSNNVLPHSRVVKPSSTLLRIVCDLQGATAETLREGVTVRGEISGTVGTIRNDVVFQSPSVNSVRNIENTVYDVIISNYANDIVPGADFIPGERLIVETNPRLIGIYTISLNEVQLNRIDMKNLGSGYSIGETQSSPITPLTEVEIDPPDLPGGIRAQATIKVAQSTDAVDNIEIENQGRGYSKPGQGQPFIIFETSTIDTTGSGVGLTVACRVSTSNVGENDGQITFAAPFNPGQGYKDGDKVKVLDPNGSNTIDAVLVVRLVEGKDGQIYEIQLTKPGSGYTKIPGVTFIDNTNNDRLQPAEAIVRIRPGRKSVKMGVATSMDASQPTKFKFDAPVYLSGNANYAFVIKCPTSSDYEIYTAKIGQKIIGTDTKVIVQPNTGALFTSQNAGIWTEDQSQDITFVLHRANFKSNFTSNLRLQNEPISMRLLPPNPIETCNTEELVPPIISNPNSDNFEENNKVVKVYHPNHGLRSGDMVSLEGVDGGATRTVGGINVDNINTLHQVIAADLDNFTIKVIQGATSILRGGGNKVIGSYNRPYETINLYSGVQTFPSSKIFATNIATEAAGVTQYNLDNQYKFSVVEDIPIMDTFYYDGAKQVANYLNESKYSRSEFLDGRRSLETNITFSSIDNKVSTVIDLQRTNMNVITNLVDRPEPNNLNVNNLQRATITSDSITSDIKPGTPVDFTLKNGKIVTLMVDRVLPDVKKMTFIGSGIREIAPLDNVDSLNFPGLDLDTILENSDITITNNLEFLGEEATFGSVYSKWISKQFVLENVSDGIQVRMSAILYGFKDIRIYYRPRFVGFGGDTSSINWIPFNPEQVAPNEDRVDLDGNPVKTPGLPDNIEIVRPRSSRNVDPRKIQADEWQELTWSNQDIGQFDAISLKIVMEATNPAKCPIIDDIRIVVSE